MFTYLLSSPRNSSLSLNTLGQRPKTYQGVVRKEKWQTPKRYGTKTDYCVGHISKHIFDSAVRAITDDGMSSSKSSSVLPSSSLDTTSGDEHDVIKARDTVVPTAFCRLFCA